MRIDKEELLKEIDELKRKQYRVKSVTDYLYTQLDFITSSQVYESIGGKVKEKSEIIIPYYDEKTKNNLFLMSFIPIYYYFSTQEYCNELSNNALTEFENSSFVDYWMVESLKRLSEKEFLEILREFLSSFDMRLFNTFENALNNKIIDLDTKKGENQNETYAKFLNNKHYVLLDIKRDVFGLSVLSHELAHLYTFNELSRRSKKQLLYNGVSFNEMYSTFLEFSFVDFLKKNHILMRDAVIAENELFAQYGQMMCSLKDCSNFDQSESDWDILQYIKKSYIYSYGYAIALLLHDRYLEDPKDVMKRLDNFIFSQGLLPIDEQLDVLGLTNEDLIDTKVLGKRLQKHNQDMKKYVLK